VTGSSSRPPNSSDKILQVSVFTVLTRSVRSLTWTHANDGVSNAGLVQTGDWKMRYSKSGLFELWRNVVIEGDCVTPSVCRSFLVRICATSEDAKKALAECDPRDDIGIVAPKAYVERHRKLFLRKQARLAASSAVDVPF